MVACAYLVLKANPDIVRLRTLTAGPYFGRERRPRWDHVRLRRTVQGRILDVTTRDRAEPWLSNGIATFAYSSPTVRLETQHAQLRLL